MLNRDGWSSEKQELLRLMWDRGDAIEAIAAALGVTVPAVYMARHPFDLPARGRAQGRPARKVKATEELPHKIERVAFTTSRLMEFCRRKELETQIGHPIDEWPLVVFKELIDNPLDACEEAEVAPVINVEVTTSADGAKIVIEDNGPGIPAEAVAGLSITPFAHHRVRHTYRRRAERRAMRSRPPSHGFRG